MSWIIDIKKQGMATMADMRIKERIFIIKPKPPLSSDVPEKIFILQALPTPIMAKPAKPNVKTPIKAAFLFFS